ncbi:hypothetical protein HZF05_08405 [Sphingomonas sp. CGMCC 1.13654]|uniref:Uncharacterized protein n=1 Tax=Sphingomonas chungangi TaxID=2683589 RepID=A0A838L413_9SPHN|nr:hypothetical protein [Sphingomonas chungangi]MBA2934121.1 hypothetical protein [Sphingomonas chungangi]MVW57162.1 hypothetical protein [Sphingomonas chungangi]
MSFVEDHERRAGRRRIAGCGCIMIGAVAFIIFGFCVLALTLGDCGSETPNCHASSERLLDRIVWSIGIMGLSMAAGLAWWANKSPKDR